MLFAHAIVQPALRKNLSPEARIAVFRDVGRRYLSLQWMCWAVLLATGIGRLWSFRASPEIFSGRFGIILAVKLGLFMAMGALGLLHGYVWGPRLVSLGPGRPEFVPLSRKTAFWGRLNLLLVLAILFCAALLRFSPV